MPDVLLFGATGYTGRLTAAALARRNADFAIAGRDRASLEAVARDTGDPEVRIAEVGNVPALVDAIKDVKALITCVGPFHELGATAVEAALQAGVHYIDSTGEGDFIEALIRDRDADARAAGIAMAPAMGFDEVPADVAATLAVEGFDPADLILTYAVPLTPSPGTARTVPRIMAAPARWRRDGRVEEIPLGSRHRWAPMPPPLGPRRAIAIPLAEGVLAPTHLSLRTLQTYTTVDAFQFAALRFAGPVVRAALSFGPVLKTAGVLASRVKGPGQNARRKPWTILAEARSNGRRRNVTVTGTDVYGLTAELLATAAETMSADGYEGRGVLAPVAAVGLERAKETLEASAVIVDVKEPG